MMKRLPVSETAALLKSQCTEIRENAVFRQKCFSVRVPVRAPACDFKIQSHR